MKKLVSFLLLVVFLAGCAGVRMEDTKSSTGLGESPFSQGGRFDYTDANAMAGAIDDNDDRLDDIEAVEGILAITAGVPGAAVAGTDYQTPLVAGTDYAAPGANSDITSLTGLTTALGESDGGTGRDHSACTGMAGFLVGAGMCIDTVAELETSAGLPTPFSDIFAADNTTVALIADDLGLGTTDDVEFGSVEVNTAKFRGAYTVDDAFVTTPLTGAAGDWILITDGDEACDSGNGAGAYASLWYYGASWVCVGDGAAIAAGTYEPIQTAASLAEMEAGSGTSIRSMTPQRIWQGIAGYLKTTYGNTSALTAEPTEWVGMIALADNSSWDPADPDVDGTTPYWAICTATGTPGTWSAFLSVDGTLLLNRVPLSVATYASTGSISADDLYNGHLNNYGQAANAVLTLPAAAAGMNAILEVVDTSHNLQLAPPSGGTLRFVDSEGAIDAGFSADEDIVCLAAAMVIGEELRITTYQTGASTYAYKIVQTIGDGFTEETP